MLDPDGVLRSKLVEFVGRGDFGLASGPKPDGSYERLWYSEPVSSHEIAFESGVVLLKKAKAEALKKKPVPTPGDDKPPGDPEPTGVTPTGTGTGNGTGGATGVQPSSDSSTTGPTTKTITLSGNIPAELWNRLGTRVLPKLRTGKNLKIGIDFSVTVEAANANGLQVELKQILTDLGLQDSVQLEQS